MKKHWLPPRSAWFLPRTWLALLVGLTLSQWAQAQPAPFRFDVPAGPLNDALEKLGEQANLQIIYDQALVRGKSSEAVNGTLVPDLAVRRVLAETGLTWRRINANSIVLLPIATQHPPFEDDHASSAVTNIGAIRVQAQRLEGATREITLSGALGRLAARDLPFSTGSASRGELDRRQSQSIASAFFGDPSVSPLVVEDGINWASAAISVRGLKLSTSDNAKLDGLPIDTGFTEWPLELVERVELLKGPAGFAYGFGSPGGVINYVAKRPPETALLHLNTSWRSQSVYGAHLDAGGRFGRSQLLGIRVNAAREAGRTYADARLQRSILSLAADLRPSERLTWDANLTWHDRMLREPTPYFYFTPGLSHVPRPVDRRRNLGIAGAFVGVDTWSGRSSLNWKIADNLDASAFVGRSRYHQNVSFPYALVVNDSGDYELGGYPMGNRVDGLLGQALLETRFAAGPWRHHLTLGVNRRSHVTDVPGEDTSGCLAGCRGNLYAGPAPDTLLPAPNLGNPLRYSSSQQWSLFVSDLVELHAGWSLLFGLRYNDYRFSRYDPTGSRIEFYRKRPTTPMLAVMSKPRDGLMFYASYTESLEQGETAGNQYINAGEKLPVMIGDQYELGVRTTGDTWSGSATLFQIEQDTAVERFAEHGPFLAQGGRSRYRGLELSTNLRPATAWILRGATTWLDATYRSTSTAGGARPGNRIAGIARLQSVAQVLYAPPAFPDLSVYGGARHYGSHFYDAGNRLNIPGHLLAHLGFGLRIPLQNQVLNLRGEVNNITGQRYWSMAGIGAPRTVSLSLGLQF